MYGRVYNAAPGVIQGGAVERRGKSGQRSERRSTRLRIQPAQVAVALALGLGGLTLPYGALAVTTLTDGSYWDSDPRPDFIADPAGVGSALAAVPALGPWALGLLAGLLGALGLRRRFQTEPNPIPSNRCVAGCLPVSPVNRTQATTGVSPLATPGVSRPVSPNARRRPLRAPSPVSRSI